MFQWTLDKFDFFAKMVLKDKKIELFFYRCVLSNVIDLKRSQELTNTPSCTVCILLKIFYE